MFLSCGGIICAEFSQYTLYPLSSFGLCDAVTIIPQRAFFSSTQNGTYGVAVTFLYKYTGIFSFMKIVAVSSANLKRKEAKDDE
jgi:hypothetical protein